MNHFEHPSIIFFILATVLFAGCGGGSEARLGFRDRLALYTRYHREPAALNNYILGEMSYENGDLSRAIPLLEAARKEDDSDPFLSLRLAALYYETGNRVDAEAEILDLLKANPRDPDIWLVRSQGLFHNGDTTGAMSAAKQTMLLAPNHAEGALWLARLYANLGDDAAAEGVLFVSLTYHPHHLLCAIALTRTLLRRGRYGAAARVARELRHRVGVPADLYIGLGRAAMNAGAIKEAADWYEQAFAISPPTYTERLALIDVFLADGNIRKAVVQLFSLPVLESETYRPHLSCARRWVRAGRLFDARKILLAGLDFVPDDPHLTLYLAALEIRLARLEDAALLLNTPHPAWGADASACRDTLNTARKKWPESHPDCPLFHEERSPGAR